MATVETCLDDIPLQLKFADALVTALEGHRSYKSRDPWREASRRRDGKAQVMNGDLEKVFDALLRNEEYQESASIYFLVLMEAYRYHPYVQKQFNVLKTFITKTVRTMEESGVLGEIGEEDKLRVMQCLVRLK
ncbi:putative proteasome-associated protein ECM29-like [Apostichopus japonicus]|uniref:Putative proteasome-associated protein ECM29-like n=1 Tax=Stichopus japonicus TaxID=307972 RepID=A0A2G8JAU6_STIJA|nr:putative proteasome-associated protein ECM29-like [Apostichopus japonicus]